MNAASLPLANITHVIKIQPKYGYRALPLSVHLNVKECLSTERLLFAQITDTKYFVEQHIFARDLLCLFGERKLQRLFR